VPFALQLVAAETAALLGFTPAVKRWAATLGADTRERLPPAVQAAILSSE
jgi:hypothetical protein